MCITHRGKYSYPSIREAGRGAEAVSVPKNSNHYPNEPDDTLMEAHFFGGRLVCHYPRDACSLLRVYRLDGTPHAQLLAAAAGLRPAYALARVP
jgi:hypothetical protein